VPCSADSSTHPVDQYAETPAIDKESYVNTKELVAAVATRTGLPPAGAEDAVRAVLDTISADVAAGEKVTLAGFGTFDTRDRPARTGRNPQTGAPMDIPESRACIFRPAAKLRAAVNVSADGSRPALSPDK
jgi:DNA-binding protein HU-beta